MQIFDFFKQWFNRDVHKSICELGDQQFSCPPYAEFSYTRMYYESIGVYYDCIDLNGLGGALMLDLNEDFEIPRQYDVVTDFGTMEHIADYYMGFKNMHKLCKAGGMMVHVLPAYGHWPIHGYWRAHPSFYIKLGKYQKYLIKKIFIEPTKISPGNPSDQIYIVYEKTEDTEFMSREIFDSYGPIMVDKPEYLKPGQITGGRDIEKEIEIRNKK